uniref:Beta-defensin-like domain-containing protein n=1 Tax=Anolis carolinensis TaxID=28377 RepID=A0A803TES3_ANOCA
MKILYLLFAVLLLGLLQGPGIAEAKIKDHQQCRYAHGNCYSFFCPRGTVTIGKCSFTQKCCEIK